MQSAVFPSLQLALSWVLAKVRKTAAVRLAGWWLVGWLLSRVCRASVCPRAAEGRQARVYAPCDSAECIIQRRFAIRVDSVPSCKHGSARTRPQVLDELFIAKTRVLGLSIGEDFVTLVCVVLTQCQCVTDRRTDNLTVANTGSA